MGPLPGTSGENREGVRMLNIPDFQMAVFDRRGVCVAATRVAARPESIRALVTWLKKCAWKRLPKKGPFSVEVRREQSKEENER